MFSGKDCPVNDSCYGYYSRGSKCCSVCEDQHEDIHNDREPAAIIYWAVFTRKHENKIPTIEEEIGVLEEPSPEEKAKMDKEYNIWKIATIVATIIALGIYIIPVLF